MDCDLKQLLAELEVSEEASTKLHQAGISNLIDFSTSDPDDVRDIINDDAIVKYVETLNDDAANIVGADDILRAARSSLGLKRQQVRSDATPTTDGNGPAPQHHQQRTHGFNRESNGYGQQENIFMSDTGFKVNQNVVHHHGNRINITITNSTLTNVNLNLTGDDQILNYTTDEQKKTFRERQKRVRKGVFTINGMNMQLRDGTGFIDDVHGKGVVLKDLESVSEDDYYPIKTKPRALLLNNFDFSVGSRMENRPEAMSDSEKLSTLLKQLGFEVTMGENMKGDEMLQSIKEFRSTSKKASMVLLFIGTHGARTNGIDCFAGIDGKRISFEEVLDLFSESNCPELKGKPKIFLNQFCRQDQQSDEKIQRKEALKAHDRKDTLVVYATMPGCSAYRNSEDGTWFVSAFVKVAKDDAKAGRIDDLMSWITKVNREVTEQKGEEQLKNNTTKDAIQMCDPHTTLTRKVYFIKVDEK